MSVQEGHQYPNVVRQLQDDGGTNNDSEYWYYDNGGEYPWPGIVPPVGRQLIANSTPVRNINVDEFDLVVDSTVAGEQIYAAVFAAAVDANDPVTVRDGNGALWSGGQTSVVGENIFNVTGVVPAGRFYGFAQEDYTPKETIINYTVETTDEFDFSDHTMIPTQNEFCFQFVFTPSSDSTAMPFETTAIQFASGSVASPTNRLNMYIWSNLFRITMGASAYNGSTWTFLSGQQQDVRVRLSAADGLRAWVNGVQLLSVPAHTTGLVTAVNACKMPQFSGTDPMPYTLVKLRWVNAPLSDAEIGAWT